MPIARQSDASGSNPGSSLSGSSKKPNARLASTKPQMATLAHKRQGRSRASCSAGIGGTSDDILVSYGMDESRLAINDEELRDRVAVGHHHKEEHQRVPKGEAVQ